MKMNLHVHIFSFFMKLCHFLGSLFEIFDNPCDRIENVDNDVGSNSEQEDSFDRTLAKELYWTSDEDNACDCNENVENDFGSRTRQDQSDRAPETAELSWTSDEEPVSVPPTATRRTGKRSQLKPNVREMKSRFQAPFRSKASFRPPFRNRRRFGGRFRNQQTKKREKPKSSSSEEENTCDRSENLESDFGSKSQREAYEMELSSPSDEEPDCVPPTGTWKTGERSRLKTDATQTKSRFPPPIREASFRPPFRNRRSFGGRFRNHRRGTREEPKSSSGDEGKQDAQGEYRGGTSELIGNRRDQETETNLTDATDKGNLNDLGKSLEEEDKKIKGMMPKLTPGKSGRSWADSVEEDGGSGAGVGSFLCRLFEKQLYTDVTFYFKEEKTFLTAHRLVLAAKCDYFEKLLFGRQMKDAVAMEMHIHIKDVPLATFTDIVKFFYTDYIELTDDCAVLETYKAAKSYRITGLVERCKDYFNSVELRENNVCSTLEMCIAKNIGPLKSRCISYIKNNTYHVISSRDFEKCSFHTVRDICNLDALALTSEAQLLEAVLRWTDAQKTSDQARSDMKRGLLKCVRFLSLTPREFSEFLTRHRELMTSKEGLQVLIYLNDPCPRNMDMLPKWCSKDLRTFRAGRQDVWTGDIPDRRTVRISLKPSDGEQPQVPKLTSLLHMRCVTGRHRIKSVKFSFESVAPEGCALGLQMRVAPDGPSFRARHFAESRESAFGFEKPLTVYGGQTLQVEVTPERSHACKFLRFDNWQADRWDFECFFISRPETGRLYSISEVEYARY